ncbi:hypothetical protein [Microbacterium aerolatum]|uniref:hypothetical protein n=1 Tax=Microbacterium aerolatum TaxID=153731 RepID=UPI00384B8EBA
MTSRPLDADTSLGVRLSAICSRNRYTDDPAPVIAELLEAAGDKTEILAREVGTWAGFYDSEHTHALAAAQLEIPGAAEWEPVGRERRTMGWHSTPGT